MGRKEKRVGWGTVLKDRVGKPREKNEDKEGSGITKTEPAPVSLATKLIYKLKVYSTWNYIDRSDYWKMSTGGT